MVSLTNKKISDMAPWTGAMQGAAQIPVVYLNTNYVATVSQIIVGANGTFTTADAKTVTVVNGLITEIV